MGKEAFPSEGDAAVHWSDTSAHWDMPEVPQP